MTAKLETTQETNKHLQTFFAQKVYILQLLGGRCDTLYAFWHVYNTLLFS